MLRGHFRQAAVYSLISVLVANPLMAATPGGASRPTTRTHSTQRAQNGQNPVQIAHGVQTTGPAIRLVADRNTSGSNQSGGALTRLPSFLGGSSAKPASSRTSKTGTQRASSVNRTKRGGGLLNELFGGSKNKPTPSKTARQTPQPKPQAIDWEGIPYHQARSQPVSDQRVPIRDPKPGETRMNGSARLAQQPAAPASTDAVPQPPTLAAAPSSRRTNSVPARAASSRNGAPTRVASTRATRPSTPALSPLSSSRRSGRRTVPALTTLSPAKLVKDDTVGTKPESELVPKTEGESSASEAEASSNDLVAKKSSPKTTKPKVKPEAAEIAKKQTPKPTPAADLTKKADEVTATKETAPPAANVAVTEATNNPAERASKPASQTPPPAPAIAGPAPEVPVAAAVAQTAPSAPEKNDPIEARPEPVVAVPPTAIAKTTGAATPVDQQAQPSPAAEPHDNFTPSHVQQPLASSTPAAPANVAPQTAQAPAAVTPQFVTPQLPPPTSPSFPAQAAIAGHRTGPPASAFQSRVQPPVAAQPTVPETTAATPVAPVYPSPSVAALSADTPIGSGVQPSVTRPAPVATHSTAAAQPAAAAPNPYQNLRDPYATPRPQAQPTARQGMLGSPVASNVYPTPGSYGQAPMTQTPPAAQTYQGHNSFAAQPASAPAPTYPAPRIASGRPAATQYHQAGSSQRADNALRSSDPTRPGQMAVTSELPGLRVVTNGPSSVIIRQTHEFEIRVENRGSIAAEGVMVHAKVPSWATVKGQTASRGSVKSQMLEESDRLVWTIDSLPAGTAEKMYVRLQALESGVHNLDVDWTLVPKKSVAKIEVREPKLKLLIEGPDAVTFGESHTYRVRVLNPGDGVAPNVMFTLSPNSPTPQTQRIGNIPSGKEAQFEIELTAQDLGDLKIHGLASGDLGLTAESEKSIRVAAARLDAVLAGPELLYQNSPATYHLEVTNNGTATSKNVIASLLLPTGVRYQGGIDHAQKRGARLTWKIDALPPGSTQQYEVNCVMVSPGKQDFEFTAKGSASGDTFVALDTRVESIADLVMTIQDPAAPAPVGSDVIYEILIKNRGSRQANGVRAIAQFSNGIEPRRVEGHAGQVLTGQVLFDPISSIRPGEEIRIRVIAQAADEGHHRFRTEIRSGETVLVAEEATQYLSKRTQRVSRRSSSSSAR